MTGWWGIRCVWLRYFDVYRKSLFYSVVTTFVEPTLYLIAFGFGLGGIIKTIHVGNIEVSYRQFVFAGIVGQTILFQAFFEAAYGSFIRMYYQRIFSSDCDDTDHAFRSPVGGADLGRNQSDLRVQCGAFDWDSDGRFPSSRCVDGLAAVFSMRVYFCRPRIVCGRAIADY